MNKKILIIVIVSMLLLASITSLSVVGLETVTNRARQSISDENLQDNLLVTVNGYTSRGPIKIEGNDDFTAENGVINPEVSGESWEDAYIIELWELPAIEISNTDKYFIIRDCFLTGYDQIPCRISLIYVTNGRIQNCKVYTDSGEWGFKLARSYNNFIEDCIVYGLFGYGFWLSNADNNEIHHCDVYPEWPDVGVGMMMGFFLTDGSENNEIHHCSISRIATGFLIHGESNDNIIHHNNIFNVLFGGKHADAESSKNQWDDGSEGNYWDNYKLRYSFAKRIGNVWDIPYEISENNVDRYPLVKPVDKSKSKSVNPLENILEKFPLFARLFSFPIFTSLLNLK